MNTENHRLFLRHVAQTSHSPLALEITKAEGLYLYDTAGKVYLDLIGGISVCKKGHRHPRGGQGIKKQADRYPHLLVYGKLVQSPPGGKSTLLGAPLPPSLKLGYFYKNRG